METEQLQQQEAQEKAAASGDPAAFDASKGFDRLGGTRSLYNPNIGENIEGDEYFDKVCKNFTAYKMYMQKKNEQLRHANQRKEISSPSQA